MGKYITHNVEETQQLARQFGALLKDGDVVAFRGGMGMGKTAFTRGIALGMGIQEPVSSPTFAIVNEYRGAGRVLCHFDMYRIEGFEDLYSTGFFDYLDGNAVLAIEWSENIARDVLPQNVIWVEISQVDEDTREILIEGDERFENLGH